MEVEKHSRSIPKQHEEQDRPVKLESHLSPGVYLGYNIRICTSRGAYPRHRMPDLG